MPGSVASGTHCIRIGIGIREYYVAMLQFKISGKSISVTNTDYRLTADLTYFRLTSLMFKAPPLFHAVI